MNRSFNIFGGRKGSKIFLAGAFVFILGLLYLASLAYRAHGLYEYLTAEHKRGWDGVAFQEDDTLGFKFLPNARAFHTFPVGDKIPAAFDNNGFRIPLSGASPDRPRKTGILFLGDSFTYGDACYAEETFPYLVSKATGLSYINAGVCGYGLAHILILAENLIPRYKPDFVVVQYSPWLVSLGTNMFVPVDRGSMPSPYFAEKNSSYVLAPPVYKSQVVNIDSEKIRSLYRGKFLKFFFNKGVAFYLYEDWHSLKTRILLKNGSCLKPATDPEEVERYAYDKIREIARKNGTTLIILNLGDIEYSLNSHSLFSDPDVYFAEADAALAGFLKTSASKDYSREFGHWRFNGEREVLVDSHPNFKAHRIIADSIVKVINRVKNVPSALAFYNNGQFYLLNGNYDGAIAEFSKTMELEPQWPFSSPPVGLLSPRGGSSHEIWLGLPPRQMRAEAYYNKGDYAKAMLDFDETLKTAPFSSAAVFVYYYRGLCRMNDKEAIADLTLALKIDPKFGAAYKERGFRSYMAMRAKSGKVPDQVKADALSDLTKAIELRPKDAAAYERRAMIYILEHELQKALKDFNMEIKLVPGSRPAVEAWLNTIGIGIQPGTP
jgi:tetratricopeptide (TPR) repeat protein